MLLKSVLIAAATVAYTASALPIAAPPKLSLNTNQGPGRPPTPNNDWPKTITNGQQRQRHGSESPTVLPGSPIGPSQNYQGGNPHTPGGTDTKKHHTSPRKREAAPPKLSFNTNQGPGRPPTPNNDWPKTITNGQQRQRHGSESPTVLPGSPIGPSQNYQGGHPNTPGGTDTKKHTTTPHKREAEAEAAPPKLSLNTNQGPARPPTPNNDWPKTITNGEQRQRHGSESPTVLPGSPIGPSQNYQGGHPHTPGGTDTNKHTTTPTKGHKA